MKNDYIVLDVETQNAFSDVGGRNLAQLKISVAGVYRGELDRYETYEESELAQLNDILSRANLIVGFNVKGFDYPVLQPYLNIPLTKLRTLDIMDELRIALGHRVSLNSVAKATLGKSKNGDGLEAISLFRRGEIEKLKTYCLHDVQLTKEIYEFGLAHHHISYLSKYGETIHKVKVNWAPVPMSETSPITGGEQRLLF